MQNVRSNVTYIKTLLKKVDILCLQEHWLFSAEKKELGNISHNICYAAKSVDDNDDPDINIAMKRGYGGVAILWQKDIEDKIKEITDGGNRIQAIHVQTESDPICLINVYMPSDNKNSDIEYRDTLAQIDEIAEKFKDSHHIILCGDMNGSLHRQTTPHDKLLTSFCKDKSFVFPSNCPTKETFYHQNGFSKSQIDYFLIEKSGGIDSKITKTEILSTDSQNTSDHVPKLMSIKCELTRIKERPINIISRPNWDECDREKYIETISNEIPIVMKKSKGNIEQDVRNLENLLHKAGEKSIPRYRKKIQRKTKGRAIWNEDIGKASKRSKEAYRLWKQHGAPQDSGNPSKAAMITAKKLLRKAQRQTIAAIRDKTAENIMEASTTDTKLFHKLVRIQRATPVSNTKLLKLKGKTADDTEGILKMWQEYFQELSIPAMEDYFDPEKLELVEIQNNIIEKIEKQNGTGIDPVTNEEITRAITRLKSGKAPDEDGISAEHYKYGIEELVPFIIHVLNNVIEHLDIPTFLKSGILTPILKKEKDKTNPANYRGITVTKIFAKILQSILKERVDKYVDDIQNALQRGFSEGVSSLCAAFIASETIEESKKLKLLLILITLDAEKAFDKLNHEILFNKLYHYGIKGKLWVLLRNLYRGMNIKVKWEGQLSGKIDVLQGVQQGAKLSTSLYKCYNNVILDSIASSGLGARMGNIQVPAPTCADDIAILANSLEDAQGILDIVDYHTRRDLVKINPSKSDAIFYNCKGAEAPELNFGDEIISETTETKHLGIKRNEKNKVDIPERIRCARGTIYSLLGAGLNVRRGFSPLVAYKLWRTYAIPRCIYGLEVMKLTKTDSDMIESAQRKILRQIQGLPNNTSNTAVYILLGAEPTEITLDKNLLTLFMSMIRNVDTIENNILN